MPEVPPHQRDPEPEPRTQTGNDPEAGALSLHARLPVPEPVAPPASPWRPDPGPESEQVLDDPLAPRGQERWPPELPNADLAAGRLPGLDAYPGPVAPPAPRSPARSAGRLVREVAETIILALLIFLLVRAVVQNFQVEGTSMQPTLQTGWYLLVNKAIYFEINLETVHKFLPFIDPGDDPTRYVFRGPKRGDVIVFKQPNGIPGQERDFIKRIIGLPGEVVEVRDQTVFINGRPLDEPYILEKPNYTCQPQRVPEGHYFVLGDNRNNSQDSHVFGPIPKENIIGQAWITYWPLSKLGFVDNTSVEPTGPIRRPTKVEVPAAATEPLCTA